MRNILWIIIITVSLIVYMYLNNIQDEVINFNDSVIELLEEEEKNFEQYVNYLNKYYNNEEFDINQMHLVLDSLETNHKSIIDRVNHLSIPDYNECLAFYSAFTKYLDNDSNIITAYTNITEYIKSNTPGTDADLYVIDGMLDPYMVKNDDLFKEIQTTQEKMANKFMFILE